MRSILDALLHHDARSYCPYDSLSLPALVVRKEEVYE